MTPRGLASIGLLFLGSLGMAIGLSYVASFLAWGHPPLLRPVLGVILGCLGGLAGYRLTGGTWTGAGQVPHRAAALAGLIFLVVMLHLSLAPGGPRVTLAGASLGVAALVAIASWYWRARARSRAA